MTELELWFCGFAVFAIGVMLWVAGKPWVDEYKFWTHKCERKTRLMDITGRQVSVDLPEGQDCPWCGKQESDAGELP